MKHLVDAVRQAVSQQNWYAALSLALTLPDICGKMRAPEASSSSRYIAWVNQYLTPGWTHEVGANSATIEFLGGADMYALRCALLHEGSEEILGQRVRQAVASFQFDAFTQPGHMTMHLNSSGPRLQLQVDEFCEEVSQGVERWLSDVYGINHDVTQRIDALMTIKIHEPGGPATFS